MFAEGIPSQNKSRIRRVTDVEHNWQFAIAEHKAAKAGLHYDFHLYDPVKNVCYSWAIRHLPQPNNKSLAVRTYDHDKSALTFSGKILDGYGKGTKTIIYSGSASVEYADNNKINVACHAGVVTLEFSLINTGRGKWLILNRTWTRQTHPDVPAYKPKYKEVKERDLSKHMNLFSDTNWIMQPKIDGAHCFPGSVIVWTDVKEYKYLRDIKLGEKVLSWNFDENCYSYSTVTGIMVHDTIRLQKFTVVEPVSNEESVICTCNHKFYTDDGFIPISQTDHVYVLRRTLNLVQCSLLRALLLTGNARIERGNNTCIFFEVPKKLQHYLPSKSPLLVTQQELDMIEHSDPLPFLSLLAPTGFSASIQQWQLISDLLEKHPEYQCNISKHDGYYKINISYPEYYMPLPPLLESDLSLVRMPIRKSEIRYKECRQVYNLEVTPHHNYFVGVQRFLVSNCTLVLNKGKPPKIFSYRPSKRTEVLIQHTYKFDPKFIKKRTPSSLDKTVLRGEVYVVDEKGRAIPAREIGGVLNASLSKALEKMKARGWKTKMVLFDVVRHKGKHMEDKPYQEKQEVIKKVVSVFNHPDIHIPIMASNPSQKHKLFQDIKQGKVPETKEGVVFWHTTKSTRPIKLKFKEQHDVVVTEIFPAYDASGRQKQEAGGFVGYWMDDPRKTKFRVGTGFSQKLKEDMYKHPKKYIGLVAVVESQEKMPSGALRAPSFIQWHLDKNPADRLAQVIMH